MLQQLSDLLPEKQLDLVLDELMPRPGEPRCYNSFMISYWLNQKQIIATPAEIDFILIELTKDGFATNDRGLLKGMGINGINFIDVDEPFYFITFSGKVFRQKGGYTSKLNDYNLAANHAAQVEKAMQDNNIMTMRGGWAAAIVAVVYLVWDVLKYGNDHHWRWIVYIEEIFAFISSL